VGVLVSDQVPQPNHARRVVAAGGAGAAAAAILALSGPLIDGFEGNVLATYKDPVGILTACRGHTGPELRMGQKFSVPACDRIFDADQRKVIVRIGRCTKVDMPVASFASFTSASFNVGSGTYCTKFAPLVNAGNLRGACAKLSLYVYAKKQKLRGLVIRRARERAVCQAGL
jgi:lysozyme